MYNQSMQNDNLIKAHSAEPYVVKDKKRVTEDQNTIVVNKKSLLQRIKGYFNKNKHNDLESGS